MTESKGVRVCRLKTRETLAIHTHLQAAANEGLYKGEYLEAIAPMVAEATGVEHVNHANLNHIIKQGGVNLGHRGVRTPRPRPKQYKKHTQYRLESVEADHEKRLKVLEAEVHAHDNLLMNIVDRRDSLENDVKSNVERVFTRLVQAEDVVEKIEDLVTGEGLGDLYKGLEERVRALDETVALLCSGALPPKRRKGKKAR